MVENLQFSEGFKAESRFEDLAQSVDFLRHPATDLPLHPRQYGMFAR